MKTLQMTALGTTLGVGLMMGLVIWAQATGGPTSTDPADLARQILADTGTAGGLIVHLECGEGPLLRALADRGTFLLHGLARDASKVEAARTALRRGGLDGHATVDRWDGSRLPLADNLVNLLVCEDESLAPDMAEVLRVLVPEGIAYLRRDGAWVKTVKPRPASLDDWTHHLHDASGNPVAQDTQVGPPRRLQWIAGPRWSRHHDHMASLTSLVSTGGRLFYIMDEGPTESIQLPSQWQLIARDAFNGALLWKRELASWNTRQWPLKSGPAHLTRRLVAVGDRVYTTLALDAPVTALDAATGEDVRTYAASENAQEILVSDGTLLVLAEETPSKLPDWRRQDAYVWANSRRANSQWAWDGQSRHIIAYDAASGRERWRGQSPVAPCSLAAAAGQAVFYDGEKVISLDVHSGQTRWESEPLEAQRPVPTSTGPRTLIHDRVVLFAGNNGRMTALAADDGRTLWQAAQRPSGHQSLRDLMVAGGLVWTGAIAAGKDSGEFVGYDLLTGEVKSQFAPDVDTYWFHHRCYPSKATDKFLLTSRTGIEFIDPAAQHWDVNHWVRGGCIVGVMPCNGLVYAPMHSCGCYLESKLFGFNALAPGPVPPVAPQLLSDESRLERGPAYDQAAAVIADSDDWPTYRHDAARSGATASRIPADLKCVWEAQLGGHLTSPVVAQQRVFTASRDAHTLYALDEATGQVVWQHTAGGRIDSPPTVYQGLVLFGSADGYVYALRATDGELVWCYRAAPIDQRIIAFEQLESTWPVHGSVLVHDGVLYCTAGRSMFLDGGIRLVRLDPLSGHLISEVVMDERDPDTGENLHKHVQGLNMPVALSDVLSCDGTYLYMRSQKMDLTGRRLEIPVQPVTDQPRDGAHLFCQIGFLEDSWFHRSYWTFGRRVSNGYGGWFQAGRTVPAGRLLVFDDQQVYGYGRKPQYYVNSSVLEYHLFAADKYVDPEAIKQVTQAGNRMNAQSAENAANASDWKLRSAFPNDQLTAARYHWILDQPALQVRAMAAAQDMLVVAGYPDMIDERRAFRLPDAPDVQQQLQQQADASAGRYGGRLWIVSKADGQPVARYDLDSPPVFDGLAIAHQKLFLCTLDGAVRCLADQGTVELPRSADDEQIQTISDEPAEPDYLLPPQVDKRADFTTVSGGRVVQSRLGYRLIAESTERPCLAVQALAQPVTGRVTLSAELSVPDIAKGNLNGFLVFGDSDSDESLIKCGVRILQKKAQIVQGPLKKATQTKGTALGAALPQVLELTVQVDLAQQTVTLTANGVTVESPLARPLQSITHVGICTDNATCDFSPVQVQQQ